MSTHVTAEEIGRWKRGDVAAAEVVSIARHLQGCADCRALAETQWDLGQSLAAIESELAILEEPRPRRRWPLIAAGAAAVIAFMLFGFALLRRPVPVITPPATITAAEITPAPPTPPRYDVEEWNRLVAHARAGAELAAPAVLQELRPAPDVERGRAASALPRLEPAGVVIRTERPSFSWPARENARYVVTVFSGGEEVAQSPPLSRATWTPPRRLPRGRTYQWAVDVEADGSEPMTLPAPPAPPARFHILEAETLRDLDDALTHHAGDHLLLGLLYARAGLDDEAAAELAQVTTGADAHVARRLLNDLRSWPL
jgi:hypothetical protein